MRPAYLLVLFLSLQATPAGSGDIMQGTVTRRSENVSFQSGRANQGAVTRTVQPGRAWGKGEVLKYQLYYGPVNAGEAVISVEPSSLDGKDVLHAMIRGYTTGLADRVFRVYDVYESYMDPKTGLPVKAIRNISEGRYRYYNEVLYDRDSNRVVSQLSGVHDVPPGIMDMLSAIYRVRDTIEPHRLRAGDVIELQTWFSDELYPVVLRYRGTETIRTRMGRFHTLMFSPVSEPGRLFKTEDDITVWFSNDRNFVPLRVSLNMLVGAVRMDLIEYEGLRYELRNLL